jgi:lauroyl/myristoyl acyltransferase
MHGDSGASAADPDGIHDTPVAAPADARAGEARRARSSTRKEALPPLLRLRYLVTGTLLRSVALVIPLLPRPLVMGMGWVIGTGAYFLMAADRKVALANLDIAFGDSKSRHEKRRIAMSACRNLAINLLGLFWGPRLNARNVRRYVDVDPDNLAWLNEVRARGKGVIIVTPHYGDWELGSLAAGLLGIRFTTVTEPTKNPAIEQVVSERRSLTGHTTVPPRFAVVKLYKALARGGTIGVLIDVNGRRGRGGVWLDFFGLPVFNTSAVAELAMRTAAAIVFTAAHPLPGRRIRLAFGPEIPPCSTGDREADVKTTSQRCLDACAELIREHPEHWLWTYKRWKRRPTPEVGRYPFYSKYDPNT